MNVTLVIPGRDCQRTIGACLDAVVPLLGPDAPLREIVFVDDGSSDDTARIVAGYPVRCLSGGGRGPGAARNLGWRSARHPLIWFIDSDCVAEPDALEQLLLHLEAPIVAGAGGTYGNMTPGSWLASLIDGEIAERHRVMPGRVNFLATFNVLYRRSALECVGGFDEGFLKAQDAELAYRLTDAGYELRFEHRSCVRHFHETRWSSYLRTQRQQGHWRVWLHLRHRGHAAGDSYSGLCDHVQPPLAMLALGTSPLLLVPRLRLIPITALALLLLAQVPMTWRLLRHLRHPRYLAFAIMSFLRAFWRGAGMTTGTLAFLRGRLRRA